MNTNNSTNPKPLNPDPKGYCPLWRRLLIILYDSIAALAIMFLVSAIWVSLNSGEAISVGSKLYPIYLVTLWLAIWVYLAISWRGSGQTLGMRAWRVHLITSDGSKISWLTSLSRYGAAWLSLLLLGAGFAISLVRKDRACLHDLLSCTYLVVRQPDAIGKPQNLPKQ